MAASVAACTLAAVAAYAHDPEDAVVVTGRYSNEIGTWDSASQGAVTREGIEKRPLLRTGEVLESVPGMIVTQHSGDGKANQYFLRGYNLDHGTDFATWIDGMPVNMPTHAHGQGYMDLNFLIPELFQKVGFNKGPYFAEDGDFASVGSARISYVNTLPSSLATLTGGSFGYRRALMAGTPDTGPGHLLYAIELEHNDGPWANPSNFRKGNGVLRYSQGTAANMFSVTGMAYSGKWNSTDQIPLRALDAGTVGRFGAIDPTDGGRASRHSLSVDWKQSEGSISRTASLYAIRSKLDLYSDFTYFLNDPVNGDQFHQSEKRSIAGGAASQSWVARIGEHQSVTTAGIQFRQDTLSPVALYNTVAQRQLSVVREDRVQVRSIAPYVSNTFEWTDWFKTIAGLRADRQSFSVDSSNPANSGNASASMLSPKLSLAFGPWRETEYFVNWGRGFHSNDARGTTITVDPATGAPANRVNPLVRTTGYEVGLRSKPVAGFTTSVALWALNQASELVFTGDAGTTEPSRASKRTGLEWLAQYQPRTWMVFDGSLAMTRARFTEFDPAGPHIPGAPDKVISAGVTLDSKAGWFGSARWRYFGPRPLIEDNTARSRATSIVNARVGYAFDKKTRLSVDVYNLFNAKNNDVDYFYRSQLRGEAAAVADFHFHPVESRAVRLTLTANF
ncbi:MAG: TonB-dependent receptor [Proteobacteria bacterium]|nr:TonB-dependent receptor [Pseudomonadota bacterium]